MRLGVILTALTAVNVYVFFFREDTSVTNLMVPSSTGRRLDTAPQELAEAAREARAIPAAASVAEAPAIPAPEAGRTTEGKIGPNDALTTVLEREGFVGVAHAVASALSRVFDPRLIRPGDGYEATFDAEGAPIEFIYAPSPVVRYIVTRGESGAATWSARKEEKELERRVEVAAGVIGSSLYESIQKAGEGAALVSLLVDLFAWDINFYVDTHPGDHWKVQIEKLFLDGRFYRYGAVLAAEYGGRVGTHRAFHWNPQGQPGGGRYFDEKGQSVAKTFLKSPLRFVRISSKFDRKRFHPILHRTKAHLGVDYAAPVGTPIWASAGGRVVECQMKRGSGNTVVISHGNGLGTRYYHLSRFARGLKVGQQVRQKEVIGYVGTTGLSTGPHLHFSVTRNGAFVDPATVKMGREAPVADRAAYLAAIKGRVAALKTAGPVIAAKAP